MAVIVEPANLEVNVIEGAYRITWRVTLWDAQNTIDVMLIHGIYYRATIQERPMVKNLTKHGNSYALVIDKPILELLHVSPDTPFDILTDGQSLVLTPIRDSRQDKKFEKALKMVHKRFGRAMKRLAE